MIRIPWTSQPPAGTQIDWSNSITRDLVVLAWPTMGPVNRVNGEVGTQSGTSGIGFGTGPHGRSFTGNPTGEQSNGLQWSVPGETGGQDLQCTMMSLHSQDLGNADYGGIDRIVTSAHMGSSFHNFYFGPTQYVGTAKCTTYYRDNASNQSINGADVNIAELEDKSLVFHCSNIIDASTGRRCINGSFQTNSSLVLGTDFYPTAFAVGQASDMNIGMDSEVEDVYLAAFWMRALSDAEMVSLWINPWQIFEPRQVPIFVPGTGATGPTEVTKTDTIAATDSVAVNRLLERGLLDSVAATDDVTPTYYPSYAINNKVIQDLTSCDPTDSVSMQRLLSRYSIDDLAALDAVLSNRSLRKTISDDAAIIDNVSKIEQAAQNIVRRIRQVVLVDR